MLGRERFLFLVRKRKPVTTYLHYHRRRQEEEDGVLPVAIRLNWSRLRWSYRRRFDLAMEYAAS